MIAGMLKTLRDVRRLRMRPAHALDDNVFRQEFTREQRTLIVSVYHAVQTIRQVLSRGPRSVDVELDARLREGRIWIL
jgi:hypothetical protein